MSMIFPGMDPYLEDPQIWAGIHSRFVVYLADELQPKLRPRYTASVEVRVFVEGPNREINPDVWLKKRRLPSVSEGPVAVLENDAPEFIQVSPLEVHEGYVAILDRQSGQKVVTVIEVLSPTNKYSGPGHDSYTAKQQEVLCSDAHLVEIDLLRTGPHVLSVPQKAVRSLGPYDYLVCVNRAQGRRGGYEVYRRGLRDRLPKVGVPLADGDRDVALDLQAVLTRTYEMGDYRDNLNYDGPCKPPLATENQAWAKQLIQEALHQAN